MVNKNSAAHFRKDVKLSADLVALLGLKTDRMSKETVMIKIKELIKERNLQDPENGRYMFIKDADMKKVFKGAPTRVWWIGPNLNKYLAPHMTTL